VRTVYRLIFSLGYLLLLAGCEQPKLCIPEGQGCRVQLDDGYLQLEVSPHTIPLTPLRITVSTNLNQLHPQQITITGVDMYMGWQSATLVHNGTDYIGEVTLPICTQQKMQWRWRIRSERNGQTLEEDFFIQMETGKPTHH